MPTPNTTITAEQFNSYVDSYERVWGDAVPSSSFSDSDKSTHTYGWGIAPVIPRVNTSTVIMSDHVNHVIAQVNAGTWHTSNDQNALLVKYASGTPITAAQFDVVEAQITALETSRFNCGIDIDQGTVLTTSNNGATWQDAYAIEHKVTFSSYAQARYFFNSGGIVSLDLEAAGGSIGDDGFELLFEELGEVDISAMETTSRATSQGLIKDGFYEAGTEYTKVYEAIHSAVVPRISSSDYSDYAHRAVSVLLKGEENATGFDLFVLVRLYDQINAADTQFDQTFTINMSAYTPMESPTDAYLNSGSNDDPFTVDSTVYQFIERETPTITVHQPWYQDTV